MDNKYSMEEFLKIVCAVCIKKEIKKISFDEINCLLQIVNFIPKFFYLKNSFSWECSVESLLSTCSSFGEIKEQGLFFDPSFRVSPILNKYSNYIDIVERLIIANKNLSILAENNHGTFTFDSPDYLYNIGYYSRGLKKYEDFLFTDGDIFSDEKYIDKNNSDIVKLRNVEVINSSYSILVTKNENQEVVLNIRSDFLSDGFVVHEVENILKDRIEHYKCIDNTRPKVYRLIKQ